MEKQTQREQDTHILDLFEIHGASNTCLLVSSGEEMPLANQKIELILVQEESGVKIVMLTVQPGLFAKIGLVFCTKYIVLTYLNDHPIGKQQRKWILIQKNETGNPLLETKNFSVIHATRLEPISTGRLQSHFVFRERIRTTNQLSDFLCSILEPKIMQSFLFAVDSKRCKELFFVLSLSTNQ